MAKESIRFGGTLSYCLQDCLRQPKQDKILQVK